MAVAVAVNSIVAQDPSRGVDRTQSRIVVTGTLTLTGNYGAGGSHGDIVSFASDKVKSQQPPTWVEILENQGAGNAPLGYTFRYFNGTTQLNGKLVVQGTSAAGGAETGTSEFTQGAAYSAGTPSLNNAVLRFRAEFPFGI